jgi:three-Cys-motif partner protein
MTALLVEKDAKAHARLASIPAKYPDIEIKTHNADFLAIVPTIARDIPQHAFAFFLIDPKGWRLPLEALRSLLARPKSEVTFNFMFEFINRAAGMSDPPTVAGLDELIPYGNWRQRLRDEEEDNGSYGLWLCKNASPEVSRHRDLGGLSCGSIFLGLTMPSLRP